MDFHGAGLDFIFLFFISDIFYLCTLFWHAERNRNWIFKNWVPFIILPNLLNVLPNSLFKLLNQKDSSLYLFLKCYFILEYMVNVKIVPFASITTLEASTL